MNEFRKKQLSQLHPKKSSNSVKIIGGIVLFIIIILMIGECSSKNSPDKPSEISAYIMAKQFVKEHLRSPSTAKFPAFTASNVWVYQSGNMWTVNGYVDAQNSFGAIIRTRYSIKMEYLGNERWRLIDLVDLDSN